MAAFKSRINQLLPDRRQILHLRAEQVDSLTASDLRIEVVLASHHTQHDQLFRRDFSAWNTRHNGVRSIPLDVGHESIIAVLQRLMFGLQDVVVPEPRDDRRHRWLADFAAVTAISAVLQNVGERGEFFCLDDGEQFRPRIRKVLAQMIVDDLAGSLHASLKQVCHQAHAAATTSACTSTRFYGRNGFQILLIDRRANGGFGNIVARTHLSRIRHRIDTTKGRRSFRTAENQFMRRTRQRRAGFCEDRQ